MKETKIRAALNKRIWKTEKNWITNGVMNELLDQGVEVINRNLEEGRINDVDEKVLDYVAFKLIDQLH